MKPRLLNPRGGKAITPLTSNPTTSSGGSQPPEAPMLAHEDWR